MALAWGFRWEPPVGIEPTTYALREPPPTPNQPSTSNYTPTHSPTKPTVRQKLTPVHATSHATNT
ncbi:hypothetical protein SAMN04489717_1894 [Actinopolymorpha singaporensis]|uniref:Uncharacterized protein n=1 Tax=Actinopolymorpha singaporensis TaxID=117157 RepID=A0A1H1Q613_9ACTN|nr:hypothetical protein SAMN04489717_1894 [Actinopolymorpha singaporensis]